MVGLPGQSRLVLQTLRDQRVLEVVTTGLNPSVEQRVVGVRRVELLSPRHHELVLQVEVVVQLDSVSFIVFYHVPLILNIHNVINIGPSVPSR